MSDCQSSFGKPASKRSRSSWARTVGRRAERSSARSARCTVLLRAFPAAINCRSSAIWMSRSSERAGTSRFSAQNIAISSSVSAWIPASFGRRAVRAGSVARPAWEQARCRRRWLGSGQGPRGCPCSSSPVCRQDALTPTCPRRRGWWDDLRGCRPWIAGDVPPSLPDAGVSVSGCPAVRRVLSEPQPTGPSQR